MPFRKAWRRLVMANETPDRRLYETAVPATLRDRLRSGDVWMECSSGYRRFDSYLLPADAVPAAATELGLPAAADAWLSARGAELDRRLRLFARRLRRGELDGVEMRNGRRLHIAPVRASGPADALALAGTIEVVMPAARITEVLHDVACATEFAAASPTCGPASTAKTRVRFSPPCWPTLPISASVAWRRPATGSPATG
jgi:hypothetical protein